MNKQVERAWTAVVEAIAELNPAERREAIEDIRVATSVLHLAMPEPDHDEWPDTDEIDEDLR